MSILKNLFAAVGAVTLGAVAVGAVLGVTTTLAANDDDFDLDELRDDTPCNGCRKCAEKDAEDKDGDDENEPIVLVHVVKIPCTAPEEKEENGEKKASDADAEKVDEKPAGKAEEPEAPAEADEGKAEKK